MEGVSKRYGGVRALEDADLEVQAGRVHAILSENGEMIVPEDSTRASHPAVPTPAVAAKK